MKVSDSHNIVSMKLHTPTLYFILDIPPIDGFHGVWLVQNIAKEALH